jgi:hypothetical protein
MDMMNDDEALEEKEPLVKTPEKPIKDWFYLTYFILFLHGIGHLLPWNMFITAHEVSLLPSLLLGYHFVTVFQ